MNKTFKIYGVRGSLIGDRISCLPILNYLELKFPGSYKYWVTGKKCVQDVPLYYNHPLIDKIEILSNLETMGVRDIQVSNSCDLVINPSPDHPDGHTYWYNTYTTIQESFRMAGFDSSCYDNMPDHLKAPRLEWWFDTKRAKRTISIFPFSGWGLGLERNPSKEWWSKLLKILIKDYTIFHFGATNEPSIFENESNYLKLTELPYFEQIKMALGSDLVINSDTGSGWVIGAYGFPQITILSTLRGQVRNFGAALAVNYNNNNKAFFNDKKCDLIEHDCILEAIKQHQSAFI